MKVRWKLVLTRELVDENDKVTDELHSTQVITHHEVKQIQAYGQSLMEALRSLMFKAYFEILHWSAESPV